MSMDWEPEFAFPPEFAPESNGIHLVRPSADLLVELRAIVDFFFCRPVADYMAMSDAEYRGLVLKAQNEMDRRRFVERFAQENHGILSTMLSSGKFAGETVRLRAARPKREGQIQEVVSWHREIFHNLAGAYMVNFWVPLDNVNASTALQYVPDSYLIPDEALKLEAIEDPRITPDQQKIGLVKKDKRIIAGVDLSKAISLVVLPGEAAIFHGAMIHGMGENHSDRIRFSLDFRLISNYNFQVAEEKRRRIAERKRREAA